MRNSMPQAYLDRPAEMLVLEGYRNWTDGILRQSKDPWWKARMLYSSELGATDGPQTFQALSDFIETLGLCANSPLKTQPTGSEGLCRDEVLILGLIAGIQHGDESAIRVCVDTLSCASSHNRVMLMAGTFASLLKLSNLTLFPIPASVLMKIIKDTADDPNTGKPTLH